MSESPTLPLMDRAEGRIFAFRRLALANLFGGKEFTG